MRGNCATISLNSCPRLSLSRIASFLELSSLARQIAALWPLAFGHWRQANVVKRRIADGADRDRQRRNGTRSRLFRHLGRRAPARACLYILTADFVSPARDLIWTAKRRQPPLATKRGGRKRIACPKPSTATLTSKAFNWRRIADTRDGRRKACPIGFAAVSRQSSPARTARKAACAGHFRQMRSARGVSLHIFVSSNLP